MHQRLKKRKLYPDIEESLKSYGLSAQFNEFAVVAQAAANGDVGRFFGASALDAEFAARDPGLRTNNLGAVAQQGAKRLLIVEHGKIRKIAVQGSQLQSGVACDRRKLPPSSALRRAGRRKLHLGLRCFDAGLKQIGMIRLPDVGELLGGFDGVLGGPKQLFANP